MHPGQVRPRGCLCRGSPHLPLQGGCANPPETPAVGIVPRKLEDRAKGLAVVSLCRSCCFGPSCSRPRGFLPSLVVGGDSYSCLRDKSSSVPQSSLPRPVLFRSMCADLCPPYACGDGWLHTQWRSHV